MVSDGMVTATPCDSSGRGCDRFSGATARGRHQDVCCEDETRFAKGTRHAALAQPREIDKMDQNGNVSYHFNIF